MFISKPRESYIKIDYSHIENWAINHSFFYVNQKINNLGDLKKMFFKTYQGLEIQEILDVYTMRRVGIEESEIKIVTENYPEKFKANYNKFSTRAFSTYQFKNLSENY